MVPDFFIRHSLSKSITQTNLVLLPKKVIVNNFSDLSPISLRNFVNKILLRFIHDRLEKLLLEIISSNQLGFVKGESIIENVLFTQELVTELAKRERLLMWLST